MLPSRMIAPAKRCAAHGLSIAPRAAAIRTYAQPAQSGQPTSSAATKPPIALFGIDGTYASALYTAAAKSSNLEQTAKALEAMHAAFRKDPKLTTVLAAPTLSAADKRQIVQELQRQVGGAASSETVRNFLNTLAENNRLAVLEGVCEKFGRLMGAHRGEVELVVISAAPLENRVLRQLESVVAKSQYVGQGKKLKVVSKVNPDIKGGLIVEVGDRTIDLSVSSKMAKMNKMLRDTL